MNQLYPVPIRIARLRDQLRASDPLDQTIPYTIDRWQRYVSDEVGLRAVVEACAEPGVISRRDLASIGQAVANAQTPAHTLFLATMIWGFGKVGYGPHRTQRMLENLQGRSRLDTTIRLLCEGRLSDAYEGFRVTMCGPAFFTKFFYAVGLGLNLEPLPLVLDSRIAAALRLLQADDALDAAQFVRGRRTVTPYAEGYVRYSALMDMWAAELGCRADAIERLLFESPPTFTAPLTNG